MTGRIIGQVRPEKPHKCQPGSVGEPAGSGVMRQPNVRQGTVWQCDDCGAVWVREPGPPTISPTLDWRKLGKRERRKVLRRMVTFPLPPDDGIVNTSPKGDLVPRNAVAGRGKAPPNPPPPFTPRAERG